MPAGAESLSGPRLEFVAIPLKGTVTRMRYAPPPTKEQRDADPKLNSQLSNKQIEVVEPAGYLICLPTGNAYRLSTKELIDKKFDREPNIIGFEQANDTKSPAGRFKLARTDQGRNKAWKEMEKQVIDLCVGRHGKIDALIEGYDPNGKVPENA